MNEDESREGILVGYDGSADAELALEWATHAALQSGESVRVLVVDDVPLLEAAATAPDEPLGVELEDRVRGELEGAQVPAYTVTRRPAPEAARALADEARRATLAVVGSRGHGLAAEELVGSVSQELARVAGCPVVVVRAGADPAARRIVVGVDGTPLSVAALDFACARAGVTGETVTALYAWRVGDIELDRHGDMNAELGRDIAEKERLLSRVVAEATKSHPDVTVEQELAGVGAGRALVDASGSASLVVVGSHGRGPLAESLLGSVSHHVLHRAHCPVAVVR